ncbi:MAG: hypothetical protein JWL76_34 [Thermoleophilia bacterium]|nr:hypothetical protein [Thermoleophilia bacterium]
MRSTARLTLVALLLAALAALVAGCGSDSDSDDSSSSSKTSGAERETSTDADGATSGKLIATIDAKLEVELTNVASKDFAGIPVPTGIACTRSSPATCHGTIECPAQADDGDAVALCGWLASAGSTVLLGDVPEQQICTEQYGGPEVAKVTGTLGADKVDATFSRENGCAIARFEEAAPLWTGNLPGDTPPTTPGAGAAAGSCAALDPDAPVSNAPADPAAGAADGVCATPAAPTSVPTPAPGTPLVEPEIISDPPEAFER